MTTLNDATDDLGIACSNAAMSGTSTPAFWTVGGLHRRPETAIAVGALSWYGVRRGEWWAWMAAAMGVRLLWGSRLRCPIAWLGHFEFNWVHHLGTRSCVATIIFMIGAILALRAMRNRAPLGGHAPADSLPLCSYSRTTAYAAPGLVSLTTFFQRPKLRKLHVPARAQYSCAPAHLTAMLAKRSAVVFYPSLASLT